MDTHTLSIIFIELLGELRNFKHFFNINDCAEGLLFKAILPVNDIFSDFLVAEKIYNTDYPNVIDKTVKINELTSMFIYFFIACPGFMILIYNIGFFTDRFCRTRCQGIALPVLISLCTIAPVLLPFYGDATIIFNVAVFASTCFQLVNFMDIFFHGPYMKKISSMMMDYEGRFESAPQLFIQLVILFSGSQFFETTAIDIYSICTSVVMLSKDIAESILINCKKYPFNKMSFLRKISAMTKIIPVIILTTIFRLGTISLAILNIFVFNKFFYLIPLQLTIVLPPALTIICLKSFSSTIKTLSVSECFLGIMGEMSSFTIWGKLKLHGSRWIQLGFMIYFGIIYSGFCLWTVFNPCKVNADKYALAFFCCGWMAFPLYISQVFYLDEDECDIDDSFDDSEDIEDSYLRMGNRNTVPIIM